MPNAWNKLHITSSTVVAPTPAGTAGATAAAPMTLHGISINTAAATAVINIYDWNSPTLPQNLVASITVPTAPITPVPLELDCVMTVGITVTIATAAADVTVLWN